MASTSAAAAAATYAERIASKYKLEKVNWFPGHMLRAMRLMKDFSSSVDVFLEIRDARVPISSKNDEFDALITEH